MTESERVPIWLTYFEERSLAEVARLEGVLVKVGKYRGNSSEASVSFIVLSFDGNLLAEHSDLPAEFHAIATDHLGPGAIDKA